MSGTEFKLVLRVLLQLTEKDEKNTSAKGQSIPTRVSYYKNDLYMLLRIQEMKTKKNVPIKRIVDGVENFYCPILVSVVNPLDPEKFEKNYTAFMRTKKEQQGCANCPNKFNILEDIPQGAELAAKLGEYFYHKFLKMFERNPEFIMADLYSKPNFISPEISILDRILISTYNNSEQYKLVYYDPIFW